VSWRRCCRLLLCILTLFNRTSDVAGTAQESASSAISHNYGQEAKSLATSAGESIKVNSKTLGNALQAASLTGLGTSAVQGAANEREQEQEQEQDQSK
jgi:hypothetical protein